MAESIGLAEFLDQVKCELMQPAAPDGNPVPLLTVEDVEVEIKVGVSKQGKAGVNIHVVELGGQAQRDDVHTVRVKLSPILSHDERVAALRKNDHWDVVEREAVRHLVKSGPNERLADQYEAPTRSRRK